MQIQIAFPSGSRNLQDVKDFLDADPNLTASNVQLELRTAKVKYRNIDPTLLVAIVGAAGTGLGALITGLLKIGEQVSARKIVLETQDGQKLEVPANTSLDKIDHLLDRLSQMNEVNKISVE